MLKKQLKSNIADKFKYIKIKTNAKVFISQKINI